MEKQSIIANCADLIKANELRKKSSEQMKPLLKEIRRSLPRIIFPISRLIICKGNHTGSKPLIKKSKADWITPNPAWPRIEQIEIRFELKLGYDEIKFEAEIEFRGERSEAETGGIPLNLIKFNEKLKEIKLGDARILYFKRKKDFDFIKSEIEKIQPEIEQILRALQSSH